MTLTLKTIISLDQLDFFPFFFFFKTWTLKSARREVTVIDKAAWSLPHYWCQ